MRNVFILFFLTLLLNGSANGQTTPAQQTIPSTPSVGSCGMSAGKIIGVDGSICQEDQAMAVLAESYPQAMQTLKPVFKLDFFEFPELNDQLVSTIGWGVFEIAYNFFHTLVLYVFGAYVSLIVILALLRTTSAMPIENSRNGQQDTIYTWGLGGSAGGLMMIPVSNGMFLGPALIFCLAISSISIANAFSSSFLNIQQHIADGMISPSLIARGDSKGKIDRQEYLSDVYVRYLVQADMCRQTTNSLIISKLVPTWNSPTDALHDLECLSSKSVSIDDKDQGGDVRISFKERASWTSDTWRYMDGSSVDLGMRVPQTASCSKVSEIISSYSCGQLEFAEANIGQNPLMDLIDDPLLMDASLDQIASTITPSSSPAQIQKNVYEQWNSIYVLIAKKLQENSGTLLSDDNLTPDEIEHRKQVLIAANTDVIRQLSRYFHQNAMNAVIFGRVNKRFEGAEDEPVSGITALYPLLTLKEKTKQLATLALRLECVSQLNSLAGSAGLSDFITGAASSIPQSASTRCLDIETRKILEWDEASSIPPEQMQAYIESRTLLLRNQLSSLWKETVQELAARRTSVERSFVQSVDKIEPTDWWSNIRKRGFLAMGNFAHLYTNYIDGYKKDLRLLNNNFDISATYFDSRYIAKGVLPENSKTEPLFVNAIRADQQMMTTRPNGTILDPLIDRRHWLSQQEVMLRQPSITNGEILNLEELLGALQAPLDSMKRLGVSSLSERNLKECDETPSKCPLPVSDPLVELSLMGHDMVNTGIAFYTLAAGLKSLQVVKSRRESAANGEIGQRSRVDGVLKTSSVASNVIGSALTSFTNVFDIIYSLLGGVMALYIAIGAVLAYVLPALPSIYLNLVFLAWMMVVLMTTLSIFLWSIMWIRFREHRDIIKKAGVRFGIELLFRPTLGVIAVIGSGFIFYMSAAIATMTMGWMNQMPLNGEGGMGLRTLVDPLILVVLIFGVFGILLKQSYSYMDHFINEVLSMLGAHQTPEKDKMSDMMKAVLFDGIIRKVSEAHNKLSNDPKMAQLTARRERAGRIVSAASQATRS